MKLYARNGYLICEPYEVTKQNSNSLLIKNNDSDNIAKIIEKENHNTIYDYEIKCEINDIILYNKDKAKECVVDGKKYIIVDMADIFAVIGEEE